MSKKQKTKISYEREADVLTLEVSKKSIDYAEMIGNVIVHFTKDNDPVLLEILEASKFLSEAENLLGRQHLANSRL